MVLKKLKSGALQFTVFIAVLIAMLLSGLILYAYTLGYFKQQSKASIENVQWTANGIAALLHQEKLSSDTLQTKLPGTNFSMKSHLSQWGCFQKAFIRSTHRKKAFEKMAFISSVYDAGTDPTLCLKETFNPLTIVGGTKLEGNIFLPSQGVKPGYISGNSFYGNQLVNGSVKPNGPKLPELDPDFLNKLITYSKKENNDSESLGNLNPSGNFNSFRKPTRIFYSAQEIVLDNSSLTGNFIIKSDKIIRIKSTSRLKDIIAIAPMIIIDDKVEGAFQAIASISIMVGKDVKMNYPSALLLYSDAVVTDYSQEVAKIVLAENAKINGNVCFFRKHEQVNNFMPNIIFEKNAKVIGQVYCNGNLELKGQISGAAFVNQFVVNEAGSVFVNHIYNGIIENKNIPNKYAGFLSGEQKKGIVKWLY